MYITPPRLNLNNLISGNLYYIVGNKGLGKTATLRHLSQKIWNDNHSTISTFILFEQDYTHQQKTGMVYAASQSIVTYEVDPEEALEVLDFSLVWRWHLFLTIVRDNKDGQIFSKDKYWKKFERFVTGIFNEELQASITGSIDLGLPENLPSLFNFIQPHISIELPEFKIGRKEYTFEEAMKEADESFLLLDRKYTPYYIFVDELDVFYGEESKYLRDLRLVHDLAIEVKRLNQVFHDLNWYKNTKLFCTLRPEVILAIDEKLPARNLAREINGYRFDLSWTSDSSETWQLPIMKLMLKRIEKAEEKKGISFGSDRDRYQRWFPDQIDGMEPSAYIRRLTWSRPRDIVRLLQAAQLCRGNDTEFTDYVFQDLMREYSKGSLGEIKGELEARYPSEDIEEILDCFINMPERFTFEEFKASLDDADLNKEYEPLTVLKDLYRVGAIGQITSNGIRWAYQGDKFKKKLDNIVHRGIAFELEVVINKGNSSLEPKEISPKVKKLEEEIERLKTEKEGKEEEIERLKAEKKGNEKIIESLREEQKEKEEEIKRLKLEQKEKEEEIERLKDAKEEGNEEIIENLRAEKEEKEEEIKRLKLEQKEKEEEMERLKAEKEEKEEEIKRLKEEKEGKEEIIERLKVEKEGKEEEIERLKLEKKEKEDEIERLKAEQEGKEIEHLNRERIWQEEERKKREEERRLREKAKKHPWTGNPEKVGEIVTFGRYPQEGENATPTGIEWRVLYVRDGKSLLISQYALDVKEYNEKVEDVTWETCTLRRWLNQEFLQKAFTQEEQGGILTSTVENSDNERYQKTGGNDTKDKVFLLSIGEATILFSSDEERLCFPTKYALAQNNDIVNKEYGAGCFWWLRSPGYCSFSFTAAVVWPGSSVDAYGDFVDSPIVAVRPALWLNLSS